MTAVLETRDGVIDGAAEGASTSNTMKAKALHTALTDALLFAAPASMRLPFLEAVRLEFGDGQLVAAATDRMAVGVSRVEYVGDSFAVVVSAREAKALAKMAKTATRRGQASRWVEIVAEGRDVAFRFSTGESLTVRALDAELPDWRKLIPRDAHLMGGIAGMGYHPSLVAKFAKVRPDEQGPGTSMVLFASVTSSGKPGPTVVRVGENFVGVLMPQRPPGDTWEYRRPDWLDDGASDPVGATAGVR